MGVCCSKTAKETGASSSRHYVSASSSPSLFPTENEYEQDCAMARHIEETCSRLEEAVEAASKVDFNEKRSRSGFIETDVGPMWEAKHLRQREKKESWESLVHRPRWNAEWSEESSTENEDGDNQVIPLKPRCSGAMRRLKKKDSTRQPNYKDEIMLTDNIDSIVEKEIPEIADDVNALAESPGPSSTHSDVTKRLSARGSKKTVDNKLATNVECILSDEPDAKSNGTTASIAGAAPGPKKIYAKRRNRKAGDKMLLKKGDVEERDVESSPLAISSVSTSRLEKNRPQKTMDEEDIRVAEEIKNILKDDCLNFSNEPTAPSGGEAQKLTREGSSRKGKHVKPLEEVVEDADIHAPTASGLSQMQNDSLASLDTKQHLKKYPTREKDITDDENPVNDINWALKDDVAATESKGEIPTGRVSPAKKAQRPKKNSTTGEKEITDDEKLADDIEYILNDDIPAAESNRQTSGRVSPSKKVQHVKKNSIRKKDITEEEKLADDIEYILNDNIPAAESNGQNTTGRVSPSKIAQHPKKNSSREKEITDDEKLGNDIDYVLNDDIPATESNEFTAGRVSPWKKAQHPKKNSSREKEVSDDEKLADDIDYILNDDIPATKSNEFTAGRVSPTKKARRAKKNSSREKEVSDDEKLADDIDYILNYDIPATESNEFTAGRVSPTKKARRAKKKPSENKHIDDKNIAKDVKNDIPAVEVKSQISSRKVSPKKKVSFQEPDQTDDNLAKDVEDGSNEKVTSGLGALPPPTKDFARKHSKQADEQLAKDIEFILKDDDIFAVEPEVVAISSSPIEIPRPKTSNPRLLLAMEMDRIFDPASIDCSDQADDELAEDMDAVHGVSNATMSSSSGAAPRRRKKTRRRKSKYMTIVEDLAEETDSNVSVTSTSSASPSLNDFTSSSGTAKHQRTHSTRSKENVEEKAVSKDKDHTLKGHLHTGKSLQPIPPSSGSLPRRPKTRNPKRMLAMNTSNAQSASSAAGSSSRAVSRPKQDSLRKPRQATHRLTKDGYVQGVSNGQMPSARACAAPRTNSRTDSTKKSKDTLILEDVDSGEQIDSSSCTVTRSPKVSPREQNHVKDVITMKKSDDKLQDTKDVASIGSTASSVSAGTRLRKKHPTRQPKETEGTNLDEMINEILEVPTVDSGASGENLSDVAASIKKKNSTTQPNKSKLTEETDLDEAIEEIFGIPTADSGASRENLSDVAASLIKKNSTTQPNKSKHTEEIDLDEAIEEILGIPTLDGDSKQGAKLNSISKERKTNSRKKDTGESRGICNSKKPSAQTTSVPDFGFPDAKASSSSVETMNCESGCSVASGNTMRPMAAGSSRVKSMGCPASSDTVTLPSSHITRQQLSKKKQTLPAILIKEENTVRKPRMGPSKETAEPSLGGLQGTTTHRKPAVPVAGGNSSRTSPGIFYESEELELMKQIERESRCC